MELQSKNIFVLLSCQTTAEVKAAMPHLSGLPTSIQKNRNIFVNSKYIIFLGSSIHTPASSSCISTPVAVIILYV